MRSRVLAAVAIAAAALTTGPAAHAACPGTDQVGRVCVNTDAAPRVSLKGSYYEDCVYLLDDYECTPVRVPIPTVQPGEGDLVTISCGSWGTC